jgi:hypothetical protein
MQTTSIPPTLLVIPPQLDVEDSALNQAALEQVAFRLLVSNDRRHQRLLLEAALFALLDMLFSSLITTRQLTCDMNFDQIQLDNGSEFLG